MRGDVEEGKVGAGVASVTAVGVDIGMVLVVVVVVWVEAVEALAGVGSEGLRAARAALRFSTPSLPPFGSSRIRVRRRG